MRDKTSRLRDTLSTDQQPIDGWLVFASIAILCIGWVMVTSASSEISSERFDGNAFYYSLRHGIFILIGLIAACCTLRIPMSEWQQRSFAMLMLGFALLIVVLIVGREINGAKRWIPLPVVGGVQASEIAKLCLMIWLAGYLERRLDKVRSSVVNGLILPCIPLMLMVVLLALEPDFGSVVVMGGAVMGMLLLSGVAWWGFIVLLVLALGGGWLLAIAEPYRWERLTTYTDPWANMYDSGYQLTQALIAFGRGHLTGMGLGNSVQKLFYLPEAHTDFVFAVLAEELGLIGATAVVGLFALLIYRAFKISRRAELAGLPFNAYLGYGIALVFGAQAFINIGVASGLLPTKGLTLPLMSYGGSSLIISCVQVAVLLRIDAETRLLSRGTVTPRRKAKLPTDTPQGAKA
ncbi:putative lipid II flippase FtsW [Cobetia sp. L2A1]|uniref:putative lipid II flippase FtsW n=1 Tax=Cobetia sp. L2A1 TaxID=2686360 RepID=UPI00131B2B40|nr:putative lipid II flippase FtsW [Cobetia sp. L2A1]